MTTKGHFSGGADSGDGAPAVLLCLADGTQTCRPLWQVTARQVAGAGPWRTARSARGQAHYPGYYWVGDDWEPCHL